MKHFWLPNENNNLQEDLYTHKLTKPYVALHYSDLETEFDIDYNTINIDSDYDESKANRLKSEPLRFIMLEDAISISSCWKTVKFSRDDSDIHYGNNWSSILYDIKAGDVIWVKGDIENEEPLDNYLYPKFSIPVLDGYGNAEHIVDGNVMSLCAESKGWSWYNNDVIVTDNQFRGLFYNDKGLISAEYLALPATTLTPYCYAEMFMGCTSLEKAPHILPALTLSEHCYEKMFCQTLNLGNVPQLPATTLTPYCYANMFSVVNGYSSFSLDGVSLELPATTLSEHCYESMFERRRFQTTPVSVLPATTLAPYCYASMFSQNYLNNAPEILATTLADYCCYKMFYYNYIVKGPDLLAETLVSNCYNQMFIGNSKLKYIKCLATSLSAENATLQWLSGVASSGTFVKADSANWQSGISGIPTNWITGAIGIYGSQVANTFVNALNNTITLTGSNSYDSNWTFTSDVDWITSNTSSGGPGSFSLTLNVANNTTFSQRQGVIHLNVPDQNDGAAITITQSAPEITINKSSYSVGLTGGSVTVTGYSTYSTNWSLINNESWITDNISSTSPGTINFTLTVASGTVERTGTVYIACQGMSQNIPITINQVEIVSGYSVNLNNEWIIDSSTSPEGTPIYKSNNWHQSDTDATMYITIQGYTTFDLYARADSEEDYDELYVYNIDSATVKKFTGSDMGSSYSKVSFTCNNDAHTIKIVYHKDESSHEGSDRGYIYIPSTYNQL